MDEVRKKIMDEEQDKFNEGVETFLQFIGLIVTVVTIAVPWVAGVVKLFELMVEK